jgi:hypothetical protein
MKKPREIFKPHGTHIAAAIAAVMMLSGTAIPAASAAVTSGAQGLSPDTSVASCGSNSARVKLWGSLGEACYTGNGTILVHRPGVYQEQIVGLHTVCLSVGSGTRCASGPAKFRITPPVQVDEISIRTP